MKNKVHYISALTFLFIQILNLTELLACAKPVFTAPTAASTISRVVITKTNSNFEKAIYSRNSARDGNTDINSGLIFSARQPYYIEVSVQNPATVGLFIDVDNDGVFQGTIDYFLQLTYKIGSGGVGTVPIPKIYYGYMFLPDTTKLATMAILSSNQSIMTKTSLCNASIPDGDAEYYTIGISSCNKQPANLSAGIDDTLCKNTSTLLAGTYPTLKGSKAYWKSTIPIKDSTNMNQRTTALSTSTEFILYYYEASTQCEYSDSKWAYVDISPSRIDLVAKAPSFCEGSVMPLELNFGGKNRNARLGSFTKYWIQWWKVGTTLPVETSTNDIYNAKFEGSYYATIGYSKLKDCVGGTKTTTNTVPLTYLAKPKVSLITTATCTDKAKLTATGVNPLSGFS